MGSHTRATPLQSAWWLPIYPQCSCLSTSVYQTADQGILNLVTNHITHSRYLSALIVMAASCGQSLANSDTIYLEDNGYVLFEVENVNLAGDWVLNTDIKGYRGSGYLEWTGPNYFAKIDAGSGLISYPVRITTAGNYELRWRSRIAKGDSNTESNDSWVRFPSGNNVVGEEPLDGWTKVYMGESDTWSWSSRTVDHLARPVRQFFTAGDHTVEIAGRSNGHAIDQIALYRYPDVSFDPGLSGTLPLSRYLQSDGQLIDPNPMVVPNPEDALEERLNVVTLAANSQSPLPSECTSNSLLLTATQSATQHRQNEGVSYQTDELIASATDRSILLAYDLSLLPPLSTASLRYTTGAEISNGTLNIHSGSHNQWPVAQPEYMPDAMVQLATAQGGWDSSTTYQTQLDASILPRELTTFILSLQAGSDALPLSGSMSAPGPLLLVSGDDNFCADWATNVAEANQQNPSDGQPATVANKSKSGSISHWFALLLLLVFTPKIGASMQVTHRARDAER